MRLIKSGDDEHTGMREREEGGDFPVSLPIGPFYVHPRVYVQL